MNILFLMCPLRKVIYEKDTSYVFMKAAHQRGHRVYHLPQGGMTLNNGSLRFRAQQVEPLENPEHPFHIGEWRDVPVAEVSAVFIRTDPPFDESYLLDTWLLEHVPPSVFVINRPSGIRAANEKIWASQFVDIVPETLVTCSREQARAFLDRHDEVIAKPTDGFGGNSVFYMHKTDRNVPVILETLTQHDRRYAIFQRYLPDARMGDKRILLLNGEPLGAVLRVHSKEDHRNNFFAGGTAQKTDITDRDRQIIERLKPDLQRLGLYFVGIDVIGDYLIEVNVTSPTCVQEINRLYGVELESQVMDFVETARG